MGTRPDARPRVHVVEAAGPQLAVDQAQGLLVGARVDITELAPLSVKSEGNFDDILADDMPHLWVTDRPATATGGSARKLMTETIESAARKILARRKNRRKA